MNTLDRLKFIINEYDWTKDIGNLIFNELVVQQSYQWDKHQWFKLDKVYTGFSAGKDLKKLLKDGTIEAVLKDHPHAEVKKGYARITKKFYDSERKRMKGMNLTKRDLGT